MKTKVLSFRIDENEAEEIKKAQRKLELPTLSEFILYLWDRFKRDVK